MKMLMTLTDLLATLLIHHIYFISDDVKPFLCHEIHSIQHLCILHACVTPVPDNTCELEHCRTIVEVSIVLMKDKMPFMIKV